MARKKLLKLTSAGSEVAVAAPHDPINDIVIASSPTSNTKSINSLSRTFETIKQNHKIDILEIGQKEIIATQKEQSANIAELTTFVKNELVKNQNKVSEANSNLEEKVYEDPFTFESTNDSEPTPIEDLVWNDYSNNWDQLDQSTSTLQSHLSIYPDFYSTLLNHPNVINIYNLELLETTTSKQNSDQILHNLIFFFNKKVFTI